MLALRKSLCSFGFATLTFYQQNEKICKTLALTKILKNKLTLLLTKILHLLRPLRTKKKVNQRRTNKTKPPIPLHTKKPVPHTLRLLNFTVPKWHKMTCDKNTSTRSTPQFLWLPFFIPLFNQLSLQIQSVLQAHKIRLKVGPRRVRFNHAGKFQSSRIISQDRGPSGDANAGVLQ